MNNEYYFDLYDLSNSPFFSLEKVIGFHRRCQQGFWEIQILFLKGEDYTVGYNEVKQK